MERKDAVDHQNFLIAQVEKGAYNRSSGRKAVITWMIDGFHEGEYPEKISNEERFAGCNIFGHICPVFIVAEPFTETTELRNPSRDIPFHTRLRVVRRDNYTCQDCGKHLREDELEFDHKIPYSRGGTSDEHNIRLTCFDCNRKKGNKVVI